MRSSLMVVGLTAVLLVLVAGCGGPGDSGQLQPPCSDVEMLRVDEQVSVVAGECRDDAGRLMSGDAALAVLQKSAWTTVRPPMREVRATMYVTAEDPAVRQAYTLTTGADELTDRFGPPRGELELRRGDPGLLLALLPLVAIGWWTLIVVSAVRAARRGVVVVWLRR